MYNECMSMSRYERQMQLPQFGEAGQRKLNDAKVLIVGAGGLGTPVSSYLAAAGVGTIGIMDGDLVEKKNLHRQVMHPEGHVGIRKARSAKRMMQGLNSEIVVNAYTTFYTEENALEITGEYDLVVDCSDNFDTRYLTNATCLELGIPWVFGAVHHFEGQVSVFGMLEEGAPCYECLFPSFLEKAPMSSKAILGTVPAVVGSLQATEAIKILLGLGEILSGRLLHVDLLRQSFETVTIEKRLGCVCNPYKD